MKQNLKTIAIILGLILALVVFFQVSSCIKARNIAKVSRLEGELKAATDQADKTKADNKIAVDEMREEIRKQEIAIAAKNKTILELVKKDEMIIPTEIVNTPEEGQDWEKIAGINAQAAREWREKYYNAQETIRELGVPIEIGRDPQGKMLYRYPPDSVTWKLNAKYLLSEERAKKLQQNLDLTENLNRIQKSVIVEKDKENARLKLGKTVTSFITYPLAIFGAVKIGQAFLGIK